MRAEHNEKKKLLGGKLWKVDCVKSIQKKAEILR